MDDTRRVYKQKLCIVTELASISVEFVEPHLLRLEECLQNEQLEIRRLFVDMFASLFTQSCPALSSKGSWSTIFRVFLKRFDDISAEIRLFMAHLIGALFQTQLPFKKEIQDFCVKRVEDLEEDIRSTVIQQVAMASIQHSSNTPTSIMPLPLFTKMLMRTLDKKESVRFTAIEWISKLFAAHLRPYWRNHKPLPAEMRALLPIPKKLVGIINSVDLKTKLQIETMFDREVVGNAFFKSSKSRKSGLRPLSQSDIDSEATQSTQQTLTQQSQDSVEQHIKERMNVILGIMALLPEESRGQFQKYFMREKYQIHAVVNKVLSTYNELRMATNAQRQRQSQSAATRSSQLTLTEDEHDVDLSQNITDNANRQRRSNIAALQTAYKIAYSNFDQRFPLYGHHRRAVSGAASSSTTSSGSAGVSNSGSPKSKSIKSMKSGVKRPSDYLKQLVENPNGKIRHYLQKLCSPTMPLQSMYIATENLLSFVNVANLSKTIKKSEATKLREFTISLCTRLRNVLFAYDAVPILLWKMVDIMENHEGQPRALVTSGMYILQCLCDEIPSLFEHEQCLHQLVKVFNFPKSITSHSAEISRDLSFVALRILSRSISESSLTALSDGDDGDDDVNGASQSVSEQWIADLTEKAKSSSNHEEAELATECLIRCSGKYSATVKALCKESSKELDITEQYLPTLLSTLSVIAKLSPNVFIGRAGHIVAFILETLLPFNPHSNDGIYDENQVGDDDDDDAESVDDENTTNVSSQSSGSGVRHRNRRRRGRGQKKRDRSHSRSRSQPQNMTPMLLTSKQCGIRILVNYLLSIADLPADQLGMASVTVGISPIKSTASPSSSRRRSRSSPRRSKRNDLDLPLEEDRDDAAMDDVDEDGDIDVVQQDEVQLIEDSDPFSRDAPIMRDPISPEIECDRIIDALFDLIRKYGRIDPREFQHELRPKHRKTPRKYGDSKNDQYFDSKRGDGEITEDEMCVVNMAVDAMLDIIRQPRYRRLFGLPRMYEIGFLIHHRSAKIRQHTLRAFWNRLRDQKLPSHFSCVFPLAATVPNKKVRDVYKGALAKYLHRMRLQSVIKTGSSALTPLQISKLPEYVLFYLVHLLANHPDFDQKQAQKEWKRGGQKYKNKTKLLSTEMKGRRYADNENDQTATSDAVSGLSAGVIGGVSGDGTGNDKEEDAEGDGNDTAVNAEGEDVVKDRKKRSSRAQSVEEYFGAIFDFYFDALLRGNEKADQYPLIHRVISKIDECYDVYHPLSKAHRFLARIALSRFQPRYKGKKYGDFPGRVAVPKVIFKLRDKKGGSGSGYDSRSPRRTDGRKERKSSRSRSTRESSRNRVNRQLGPNLADSSLLQTTASDSTLAPTKRKKGIFSSSEMLKRKYGDISESGKEKVDQKEEERPQEVEGGDGSDHPSDNDVVDDMPGFDLSAIRRNLDESLIDHTDNADTAGNGNGAGAAGAEESDKGGNGKVMSSGSGADADDETNSAISPKRKAKSKRSRTVGRKRKRKEMAQTGDDNEDEGGDAENDADDAAQNEDMGPPKKKTRSKRKGR